MSLLPERRTLVHKAIDIGKLSKKNAPILDESKLPDHRLYDYTKKYDGCHTIVRIGHDHTVSFWSRAGKVVRSLDHFAPSFSRLSGLVLFCEAWAPGLEHREISGMYRRHSNQPLHLVVFDVVYLDEFDAGISHRTYSRRKVHTFDVVCRIQNSKVYMASRCDPWEVGKVAGDTSGAYDGAVAKLLAGLWRAGAGAGGEVLKIKNIVDVDLLCIGVEEGEGKHAGRMGAIVCRYENGVELRVGTGFPDVFRETVWNDPEVIVGKIVRIIAMTKSGKGSLREPRYDSTRFDKDEADY